MLYKTVKAKSKFPLRYTEGDIHIDTPFVEIIYAYLLNI